MATNNKGSVTPPHTPGPGEVEAFRLGIDEADGDWGRTYDGDANSPRSVAYDFGRMVGEMPRGPWRAMLTTAPDTLAALEAATRIMEAMGLPTWVCDQCGEEWSAMTNEADVPEKCSCGGTVTDTSSVLSAARSALARARGEGGRS